MIGNLNIVIKKFDFQERILIGWLANTVREPANQDAYLKVQHFCFYVKIVYHFRPEYRHFYKISAVRSTFGVFLSFVNYYL